MVHNVLGLYRDEDMAEKVVDELEDFGCQGDSITVVKVDDGELDIDGGLEEEWDDDEDLASLKMRLESIGVPRASAEAYFDGLVRDHGALVIVRCDEARAERVAELMRRHGAIDISGRGASGGRAAAMQQSSAQYGQTMDMGRERPGGSRLDERGEGVIPVIAEQVEIDTRRIADSSGVRVFTHIVARPIDQELALREERARVDGWEAMESSFREDWKRSFGGSGPWEQYAPAYRYGFNLANDSRFTGQGWDAIETTARRDWEAENPDTWDRFKAAIWRGWSKVTDQAQRV